MLNNIIAWSIAVEVLEVYLEEMYFFLNVLKNNLVMPIVHCSLKNRCKEKLIQMPNLINIKKDSLSLLRSDDLLVNQRGSEIWDDDT